MNRGVVYLVYGDEEKYLQEACNAVVSLREHHLDLPVALVGPVEHPAFDICVVEKKLPTVFHEAKIRLGHLTPFDQTLFLDTDTTILGDISYGFELLEKHDIALPIGAIQCVAYMHHFHPDLPLHPCDIWFNTGVFYFNRVPELFARWQEVFDAHPEWGSSELSLNVIVREFSYSTINAFFSARNGGMFSSEHTRIWHSRSLVPKSGYGDEQAKNMRENYSVNV